MLKPDLLKRGDTIGIVATARKISREELQPAIDLLYGWELEVKLSSSIFSTEHQFAGTDADRTTGLQELLDDPSVKAIICARGGYGTVRIIDNLDFTAFREVPKWIIGYSDITVLHSTIHRHLQIETLHATMPLNMQPDKVDKESIESLKNALFSPDPIKYNIPAHSLNEQGECMGRLIGGNLSVLYSLLGSTSDIDTTGKILFIEDLDEYLYHIDRMMVNMKRNGKLENLAGLIVGDMSDMKDNTVPFGKNAYEIISEHVTDYSYPICFGFPAGHEKRNLAMRFGAKAELNVKENGAELTIF